MREIWSRAGGFAGTDRSIGGALGGRFDFYALFYSRALSQISNAPLFLIHFLLVAYFPLLPPVNFVIADRG
jgi:hypothetical protein